VVSSLVTLWSAQEEAWTEALTGRGEYPSPEQARAAVRTHQEIVDHIASGQPSAAEHMACTHLAATRALLLNRFDDGIVNASSTLAQQAIRSGSGRR
jgi:GntR family transcriptional repressor for pyruvate dehydrogenase complex